jgi:hypothetical protein
MSKLNCDSLIRLDLLLFQNILTHVLLGKKFLLMTRYMVSFKKNWKKDYHR